MSKFKAIETEYGGCMFRSRLEAKWAVYFDALGIDWRFEAEGYECDSVRYLADFYFPKLKFFGEVKPERHTKYDRRKWEMLVKGTGLPLVLFDGSPTQPVPKYSFTMKR